MKTAPNLLNVCGAAELSRALLDDLQLDKLLSAQALSVLQKPCDAEEILRRQEIFARLEDEVILDRVKHCLSVLLRAERMYLLWREVQISLCGVYLRASLLASYVEMCECLVSLADVGRAFAEVAVFFDDAAQQQRLIAMREDHQKIRSILERMQTGLLSFSDKHWLTPDCDAVSEVDHMASIARSLGFTVPPKKIGNTKVDRSLSDAVCRLYAAEVGEIESLFGQYADVDFDGPFRYISELKFLLEIADLTRRAGKIGIPHCCPRIAKAPQYTAGALYDVSLLAKHCDRIVPNDVDFSDREPFFFLIGANGGGKTTYLRAVGINLILFLCGCPVFAREATVYPFDTVAVHFPRDERFDRVGRLDEELARVRAMLNAAEGKEVFLLFNETFSGTDEKRGFDLLKQTVDQVGTARHFGLFVTHFHEVMRLDYPVLSAEVDTEGENKRTYRIVKSKGSASSYAADILKKYRLDRESLMARRDDSVH